ncbi:MAG: fimbrillin family protein [Parabacteroides gordonii]|uniref:fimbrillin family protein n=1 Tax=Parabacteroides gordonii TaxID=574930 RepID=UPI003A8C87F1
MKTLVLSMISIAATVAAMTACTSESDEVDNVIDAPVEVQLNAGINNISVKSDGIQTPDANNFDANIIVSTKTNIYGTSIWTGADAGKINVVSNAVTFNTKQAYPSDASAIFMKAYAPFEGNYGSDKVEFTIDGNKDIMVSNEVTGSKSDNENKKLTFAHKLAQLNFNVIAKDEAAQKAWGKINGIKVEAITNLDLTLSSGELVAHSEAVNSEISTIGFTAITELPVSPTSAAAAGYVMVLPKAEAYTVIIESEKGPANKQITLTTPIKTVESTAYNITLTFNSTEVIVTSEVGEWKTEVGSGSVD